MSGKIGRSLVAGLLVLIAASQGRAGQILKPKDEPLPKLYFGQHMHRAATTTVWPSAPFGTWRLWDARVGWAWLEQRPGEWRLEPLDRLVALGRQHDVEILLPLGPTPQWASARPQEPSSYAPGYAAEPKDLAAWRTYVRTMATRYKGKIRHYEIWNEPNVRSFFSGTVAQMVDLTREAYTVLKDVDPANVLVSPAPTGGYTGPQWLDEFLSLGGGKYCDVIGFHFYVSPAPPEAMIPLISQVRKVMEKHHQQNKPLWNTEAGWFIQNAQKVVKPEGSGFRSKVLNNEESAAWVTRALVLSWAAGVDRFYWYAWDNELMGLIEPDGKTQKAASIAYAQVYDWVVGKKFGECRSDAGIWTCSVTGGDKSGWIVWTEDGARKQLNIRGWKPRSIADLRGQTREIPGSGAVEIGPEPVLILK